MIRFLTAFYITIVFISTAGAESYRFGLKDAISAAVEKNNRVRAAGFMSEAALQAVSIVTSRYYPSISLEESFSVSNSPTQTFMMKLDESRFTQNDFLINNLNRPGIQHDFSTALTVRQPLYDPSISPAKEIAARESEIQETRLDGAKHETAFRVFKLYLDIQKAQARLRAAEQAVYEAREHVRLAGVRNQAGTGLRSDELRARTHLSANEQQLVSARNNLTISRMELANAIGLKDVDKIDITDTRIAAIPLTKSLEELVALSLENNIELKQSLAEYEKSKAAVRLARSGYLPSAGAFASYRMNSKDTPFWNDNDSWNAGVALTWQLFDGSRRSHERDKAVAEKSAAAELHEHAKREAGMRVRESYLRSEEMGKRLEVAGNTLQDAEETVRLLTRRFENSLATMAELLDAQTALNRTRADLVDSEAHLALARGYVYYSAGIFLKEMTK
ncbi:MAG: TolC family protein [Desulfuromonadales bacterium]